MLPSFPTYAKDTDVNKQLASMRTYLNVLKDDIEAELANIGYGNLDADLRARFDNLNDMILQTKDTAEAVAGTLKVNYITASEIASKYVTTQYLTANYITASQISASYASFAWVEALDAMVGNLNAKAITTDNLSAQQISAGQITSGTLSASRIATGSLSVAKLASADGTQQTANWAVCPFVTGFTFDTANRKMTVKYRNAYALIGSVWQSQTSEYSY